MISQSQIIIRAEIQDSFSGGDSNLGLLCALNQALALEESRLLDGGDFFREVVFDGSVHFSIPLH